MVGAIAPQISIAEIDRASVVRDIDFNSYDLSLRAMAIFYAGGFYSQDKFDEVIPEHNALLVEGLKKAGVKP